MKMFTDLRRVDFRPHPLMARTFDPKAWYISFINSVGSERMDMFRGAEFGRVNLAETRTGPPVNGRENRCDPQQNTDGLLTLVRTRPGHPRESAPEMEET